MILHPVHTEKISYQIALYWLYFLEKLCVTYIPFIFIPGTFPSARWTDHLRQTEQPEDQLTLAGIAARGPLRSAAGSRGSRYHSEWPHGRTT